MSSKIYKGDGPTSQAEYIALFTEKRLGNHRLQFKYENVVGEGFGIIDGKLKIFSGAFNLAKGNDLYHDDSGYMNSESARCVESLAHADLAAPY